MDPKLNICKIKLEDAKNLVIEHNITETPLTFLFKGKQLVKKVNGYLEADELEEIISDYK